MAGKKNEKELKMNEKTNTKETTEKNAEKSDGDITDTILNTTTESILDYEEVPEIENRNEEYISLWTLFILDLQKSIHFLAMPQKQKINWVGNPRLHSKNSHESW